MSMPNKIHLEIIVHNGVKVKRKQHLPCLVLLYCFDILYGWPNKSAKEQKMSSGIVWAALS